MKLPNSILTSLQSLLATITIMTCFACVTIHAEKAVDPSSQPNLWMPVKEVSQEYDYVRTQRCVCGGRYEFILQSTGEVHGKHYDQLEFKCQKCGKKKDFYFDVTAMFEEMDLENSKKAKEDAYKVLNARYPKITREHLGEFTSLLTNSNPHFRIWGIEALAKIGTPDALQILLDGYLHAGLLNSFDYEEGLKKAGSTVVPLVAQKMSKAGRGTRWELVSLLGEIKSPFSRTVIEDELRNGDENNRRICYLGLGRIRYQESEGILRDFLQREAPDPDDSLLWALGRCGSKDNIPVVRGFLTHKKADLRAAGIMALGALGDHDSIPQFLKLAKDDPEPDIRHSAIFALGLLKAKEAVPLLIEILEKPASYERSPNWTGMYDDDDQDQAGFSEAAIHALGKIGDRRTLKIFEKILKNDRCFLDFEEVAEAAAKLHWNELVPAIIRRMARDYKDNSELFGPDDEKYSPSLRLLTGQGFSEDPKQWQRWLKQEAKKK